MNAIKKIKEIKDTKDTKDIKDIKNLFQFLKEFNKLKRRPQLDIQSFEEKLWFYEIPSERECDSIIKKIDSKEINFTEWIKIKKPKIPKEPSVPPKIEDWLKNSDRPELYDSILEPSEEEEEENKKVFLEDHPEIEKAFNDYMTEKWEPWSQEIQRLKPILRVYDKLYKIYKKYKNESETYQIVLGIGFLSSKNRDDRSVKRHIVEAPVSINFDSPTGTISVGPSEQDSELFLEMNMFTESEKPKISDEIKSKLSECSNDFWTDNIFYDCLKSWLHHYDSKGQFDKNFSEPSDYSSFSTLTLSPAIILKKRNEKAFVEFYSKVLEDIENNEEVENVSRPCFNGLFNKETTPSEKAFLNTNTNSHSTIEEKYYFPLAINEEQENIIKKLSSSNQVVVQGPPGTGKTHSIANIISHFLAKGKKILVTSQTDRALKVLKKKLPEEVQELCIEILGKDQDSLQDLRKSFSAINTKYQEQDDKESTKIIKSLNKKDDNLKGRLAQIKNKIIEARKFETKRHELFGFYKGTPAVIAKQLKQEEEKYKWITEEFNNFGDCPISNNEALSFLMSIQKIKGLEEAILKEKLGFLDKVLNPKELAEKIKQEKEQKNFIEKYANSKIIKEQNHYNKLKEDDLKQMQKHIENLCLKTKQLSNRKEKWVDFAVKDCLLDKDREWKYLYDITTETLKENEEIFSVAEKITSIKSAEPLNDLELRNHLKDFFDTYPSNNNIRWGLFARGTVRYFQRIKMNGKDISSYEEVKQLDDYFTAKRALDKLNKSWKNQGIDTERTQDRNFIRNSHIFADLCEPLEECISIHACTESVKSILNNYNIPHFQWTIDCIKEEKERLELTQFQNALKKLEDNFDKNILSLETYKNQKNQMAVKMISAITNRDLETYTNMYHSAVHLKEKQEEFSKVVSINKKLNNETFYTNIKNRVDDSAWNKKLSLFEEAWAWSQADAWLKEKINPSYLEDLNKERERLLKQQKQNMNDLIAQKAWKTCLTELTAEELSSLRGWIQAITRVGKGTGKSAERHRRTARKRMEECKTVIPAWIIPLYRVVENIKPHSPCFDVAIIDEASQTGPDGFLINYLAKQIIVVGDKEQISPDNIGVKDDDVELLKKKYLSDMKDIARDSIGRDYSYYDFCETLFKSSVQLREHFRSMPEIISFSNKISYSGTPLIPLRQYGSSRLPPLKSVYVDSAVSKVGSSSYPQNKKEAEAIVEKIQECIKDPNYQWKNFGIIVLQGKNQIKIIENELSKIDTREIEERSIHVGDPYSFQGDERDVIFLSMVIANDWSASALTKSNYKRRYNVAASRAKDQMWLFHSIELKDLSASGYRRKLLEHFDSSDKDELKAYPQEKLNEFWAAKKEVKNKSHENAPAPFDSWFELEVFLEIVNRGYHVTPQYKVSGYSIDMVITGSDRKLAVECDGEYFHSGIEAEESDFIRQARLERCGWNFWRLKDSAFRRNKEKSLEALWKLLDKMNIDPLRNN